MLITKLEIGAVGTDFARRKSWWAREVPGRAKRWKTMKTDTLCKVFRLNKSKRESTQTCKKYLIVLDETGCVLNEKMMPDATEMVPDFEIGKKVSKIHVFGRKMWWYPGIT
jgi:hypothetical protein